MDNENRVIRVRSAADPHHDSAGGVSATMFTAHDRIGTAPASTDIVVGF